MNVIIKNPMGTPVTYQGVNKIKVSTSSGAKFVEEAKPPMLELTSSAEPFNPPTRTTMFNLGAVVTTSVSAELVEEE